MRAYPYEYFSGFYPCKHEVSIRRGGDESQQTLNISVFYTLMKEVFGLDAQEQGCPVPVARILMEVNQTKNSPQWTVNF